MTATTEDLDAVVLRRIVGGRHDEAEILGQQRDRRSREHPAEDRGTAGVDDPAGERFLERRPRTAGVTADEDVAATRPGRRRTAEPLDEVERQRLTHDATDTVGAEMLPGYARSHACLSVG